jgi:hypothetical protein
MLGARCSVLGARCSVLGARCSVLTKFETHRDTSQINVKYFSQPTRDASDEKRVPSLELASVVLF